MSLFGKKSDNGTAQVSNERNIIGKGTTITGNIETFGNIRIDGRLNGDVKSKSKVALGEGSLIEGNILSQNAEIEGEVIGKIETSELLILHPTAVVRGNIFTEKLIIKSGAVFDGSCQMGTKTDKEINIDASLLSKEKVTS